MELIRRLDILDSMDEQSLNRKQRNLDLDLEVGRLLAQIRSDNGILQVDVAKVMGFGRPLVSKIEHGQRSLAAVEVPDYARAIGTKPDLLYSKIIRIVMEYDSGRTSA